MLGDKSNLKVLF